MKYLGVIINSKLKWNDHCQYVVSKATKCLNRIRRAICLVVHKLLKLVPTKLLD